MVFSLDYKPNSFILLFDANSALDTQQVGRENLKPAYLLTRENVLELPHAL